MKDWNELMEERGTRTDFPMKPQVVGHTVNKFLPDDAIIVSDCGTVTTWAARYLQMRERHDVLARPACWPRWATGCPTRSVRRSPPRPAGGRHRAATAGSP